MPSRILQVLGLTLLLLMIGVTVTLAVAHLQVRGSGTPPPTDAILAALKSEQGPVALHFLNTSEQPLAENTLTHSVFVLEWADGSLFLIDAGMSESRAVDFGELIALLLGAEEPTVHGTVGSLLGEKRLDVKGIGFTHLHIDHTEGLSTLCSGGREGIRLVQTRWQQEEHNFNTREGASIVASSCLDGTGDWKSLFPGLGVFPSGGHTPGSTLFAAWIGKQLFLFPGDTTNSKRDILQDSGKGAIYSYLMVPEDTRQTAALRKWLKQKDSESAVRVLVSHDLEDIRQQGVAPLQPGP